MFYAITHLSGLYVIPPAGIAAHIDVDMFRLAVIDLSGAGDVRVDLFLRLLAVSHSYSTGHSCLPIVPQYQVWSVMKAKYCDMNGCM